MNRVLGLTRYAVVVPALASILGALLLMAQGSISMVIVVVSASPMTQPSKTPSSMY